MIEVPIIAVCMLAFFFVVLCDAPLGYQDERGFIYGEPDDDGR